MRSGTDTRLFDPYTQREFAHVCGPSEGICRHSDGRHTAQPAFDPYSWPPLELGACLEPFMTLRLYNTLSRSIEEFKPQVDREVRMYACGPTVYDYGHIGNFRTFIVVDILRRFLRQSGYRLKHVMNITDVDDKIIRNSARQHVTVQQYTQKYEKAFLEDAATLNIEQPQLVRATQHIEEMAKFIAQLEKKGFAYRTDDGSYYYRIAKFPEY